jgi:hypothetical protein
MASFWHARSEMKVAQLRLVNRNRCVAIGFLQPAWCKSTAKRWIVYGAWRDVRL